MSGEGALVAISFEQMERMAATVSKASLFGAKTVEQALALMLLASAEGVHPMVAVRDYHIIDGRPALKADTMLARFQASGGTVEWHCMTDLKCEATFVHPQSPRPVRLDWTFERATAAGLTNKSNWKGYPRAMLRSRVISEGIRATFPGVIVGKYTPEEIIDAHAVEGESHHASSVRAVIAEGRAINDASILLPTEMADGHMSAIGAANTIDVLRRAYAEAYTAARDANDETRMRSFQHAYEARKSELKEQST